MVDRWKEFVSLCETINPRTIQKIQKALLRSGGVPYIVGGAVRDDLIPGTPESKDIDFVVTGLPLDTIARVLEPLGTVSLVGASFGVVTAKIDGEDFDFAIPRVKETNTGSGHTDVEVETDPNASIEDDLGRRDFTINALAKDINGEIIDLYGGKEDIKKKRIKAVGDPNFRFYEDPLRILRAIQFATRFNFTIEKKTARAIQKNIALLRHLPAERILAEFVKAWNKGEGNYSVMVRLLRDLGVGTYLFGQEFNPISLKQKTDAVANFVAFFFRGGNFSKLKPTNEMKKYLGFVKSLADVPVWQVPGFSRDNLRQTVFIVDALASSVGDPAIKDIKRKLDQSKSLPIKPKELDITGEDLIDLNYRGPEIGRVQRHLMAAVYADEVNNRREELIKFLQSG